MLPIWRLTPGEYYESERARHALTRQDNQAPGRLSNLVASSVYSNVHKRDVKAAQKRAPHLKEQVILQWAWGIYLFVSPLYSQPECSGSTVLFMFLHSFDTSTINNLDKSYHFFVWPFWLLFCLFVTLFLVVFLALSSPNHANPNPSTSGYSGGTGISPATPVVIAWAHLAVNVVPSLKDKARQITFWVYIAAFCLWGLFIYSTEMQKRVNCVFSGENSFGGLGQITAIFVALAPLWSLSVALYKYPTLRRKQEHHRRDTSEDQESISSQEEHTALLYTRHHAPMPSEDTAYSHESIEMHRLVAIPQPSPSFPVRSRHRPSQNTPARESSTPHGSERKRGRLATRGTAAAAHVRQPSEVAAPHSDTGLMHWMDMSFPPES
ncbi:hypothetical protein PHLCEN_2v13213 [Hermanssonia centrifuga]|uniref:Uncharacterized protein n=1 Tax=Hermanssonia centrifuga TaxID=98765 RepID=A0A2R6NF43_9APHY|nr:hypothetical protein PHLCEN_2v13213 [Hermanssonia centrifuga]